MTKRPINDSDNSSSDEWSPSEQTAKKPKTKSSAKDKGKGKMLDDSAEVVVEDGPPSMQSRIHIFDLPVDVLEQIFSVDQDLSLADHIALSGTCWYLRNAYKDESGEDEVWRAVWMNCGPGSHETEPRINDGYHHLQTFSEVGAKVEVTLPGERVKMEKAFYCSNLENNKDPEYHYSSLRFSDSKHTPIRTPEESLSKIVADWNNLGKDTPQKTTIKRLESLEVTALNELGFRRGFRRRWIPESAAQREARFARIRSRGSGKLDGATDWFTRVSVWHLGRLPLSRRELFEAGGDENKLPLKGRVWDLGPWHVLCLREINFPVIPLVVSGQYDVLPGQVCLLEDAESLQLLDKQSVMKTYLTGDELKLVKPVEKELIKYASFSEYYYVKDITWLKHKFKRVRAERKTKAKAEEIARKEKNAVESLKVQKAKDILLEAAFGPMCEPCGKRHRAACMYREAIPLPEKKSGASS